MENESKERQKLARKLMAEEWYIHEVKEKDKAKKKHLMYDVFHLVYNQNGSYENEWYVAFMF